MTCGEHGDELSTGSALQLTGRRFILRYYVIQLPRIDLQDTTQNRLSTQQLLDVHLQPFFPPCPSPSSNNFPTLILASPLTSVDSLLRHRVPHSLAESALAKLAADGAVDAVLELVHGLDAGDFGLLELFWVDALVEFDWVMSGMGGGEVVVVGRDSRWMSRDGMGQDGWSARERDFEEVSACSRSHPLSVPSPSHHLPQHIPYTTSRLSQLHRLQPSSFPSPCASPSPSRSPLTFRSIAGLVITSKVLQVLVLEPRHVAFIRGIVLFACPLAGIAALFRQPGVVALVVLFFCACGFGRGRGGHCVCGVMWFLV